MAVALSVVVCCTFVNVLAGTARVNYGLPYLCRIGLSMHSIRSIGVRMISLTSDDSLLFVEDGTLFLTGQCYSSGFEGCGC